MSYLTVNSRGGLGAIWPVKPPLPGITEVASLKAAVELAAKEGLAPLLRTGTRDSVPLCMDVAKEKWVPFLRKLEELTALYPEAVKANPITCKNLTSIPRYYPDIGIKAYYDEYVSTRTVNIDMTPAVNTVAAGTPGSFNVAGTQKSGKLYGYNFADQAAAQAYAQAVVDSGGTATMYQVPVAAPSAQPPPTDWSSIVNGLVNTSVRCQGSGCGPGGDPAYNPVMQTCKLGVPCSGLVSNVPQSITPMLKQEEGVYLPPPMTPDQTYDNPILPPTAAAPAKSGSGLGIALLLAIPAAWFALR